MGAPFLLTLHWGLGLPAGSLLEALVQAAGQCGDSSVELEAQQLGSDLLGRQACSRAEGIDVDGIVSHVLEQPAGLRALHVGSGGSKAAQLKAAELRQDVLG